MSELSYILKKKFTTIANDILRHSLLLLGQSQLFLN